MKKGSKNAYARVSYPVSGAEEAMAPRSHAHAKSGPKKSDLKPVRRDMYRRQMLSSRKEQNS